MYCPWAASQPCQLDDVSWIKPGNGIWDWRFRGYDNGTFRYRLDERSLLHLIDFAEGQGLDWLNLDAGWSKRQAGRETILARATAASLRAADGQSLGMYRWIVWAVSPVTRIGGGENTAFQELSVEAEELTTK